MAHNTGIWLIWFTMNSLQQIILFIFCFFLVTNDEKKSLLGMEDKKQDQKEEEKKGLELFDLNSNIYKWIFLTVYWVFQGEK